MSKELKKAVKAKIFELTKGVQGRRVYINEHDTILDYNGETIRLAGKASSHFEDDESFINLELKSKPDHWVWKAAAIFLEIPF